VALATNIIVAKVRPGSYDIEKFASNSAFDMSPLNPATSWCFFNHDDVTQQISVFHESDSETNLGL